MSCTGMAYTSGVTVGGIAGSVSLDSKSKCMSRAPRGSVTRMIFPLRAATSCMLDKVFSNTGSCGAMTRSEEHTSELQSHLNLVCRLLLEKKKKNCSGGSVIRFVLTRRNV